MFFLRLLQHVLKSLTCNLTQERRILGSKQDEREGVDLHHCQQLCPSVVGEGSALGSLL